MDLVSATNEVLMMGCQVLRAERTLSVRSQQQWEQQPQQWARSGGKYPPKKNIQSLRKLRCPLSQR